MKDQINIIREALENSSDLIFKDVTKSHLRAQALAALTQLEAMVGEQKPVLYIHPSTFNMDSDHVGAWKPGHELEGYIPLYAAAPVAQQRKTVTNDEQASAYMDARLWEFIDMAGMWPRAKPDPRIWAHVMVYAPVAQQPQAEAAKPIYYMRDNNTFKRLSADVSTALVEIESEFNAGWSHGMLCSKRSGFKPIHAEGPEARLKFFAACKEALETAAPQQAEAVPGDVVRDAERYRYLRSHCLCAGHGSITVFLDDRHGTGNRAKPLHLEEMDVAIDAAIAASKK